MEVILQDFIEEIEQSQEDETMNSIDSTSSSTVTVIETNFEHPQVLEFENVKTSSSLESECFDMNAISLDEQTSLTVLEHKRKIFENRNVKVDKLSTIRELATYAKELVEDYSFHINETCCETSAFCEKCFAGCIDLGFFARKFAALAEDQKAADEGNMLLVSELKSQLQEKEAKIHKLSSDLEELSATNVSMKFFEAFIL